MDQLTHDDFKDFINYFENKSYEEVENGETKIHKFYDTITELSKSDNEPFDPLIHDSFQMYGLDWMARDSEILKDKLPKTVDAIYFNSHDHSLHLIEFKFISYKSHKSRLNDLSKVIRKKNKNAVDLYPDENEQCFNKRFVENFNFIKKDFQDPIDVSLQLKPFEALYIVLPALYDEYCQKKGIGKKDIKSYLNIIDKYYWVFLGNNSRNDSNIHQRAKKLDEYNKRLEYGIFKKAKIKSKNRFKNTLENEILKNYHS